MTNSRTGSDRIFLLLDHLKMTKTPKIEGKDVSVPLVMKTTNQIIQEEIVLHRHPLYRGYCQ